MLDLQNVKLIVAYEGTHFHGFQVQPRQRTVQRELEKSISLLTQEPVTVIGSGRTDAGVHAWGQTVNFHTRSKIPLERLALALNAVLPKDITVRQASSVSQAFHSRYDAKGKHYRYRIDNERHPNVFGRLYAYHVPQKLDIENMQEASQMLVGTHDFTSFCSAATLVESKVRTVTSVQVRHVLTELNSQEIVIDVRGNGFLYNMVRIIAGTLVDVGKGRMSASAIPSILQARDRIQAGVTAPAQGLMLMEVFYQ